MVLESLRSSDLVIFLKPFENSLALKTSVLAPKAFEKKPNGTKAHALSGSWGSVCALEGS